MNPDPRIRIRIQIRNTALTLIIVYWRRSQQQQQQACYASDVTSGEQLVLQPPYLAPPNYENMYENVALRYTRSFLYLDLIL
jgi:hypothetical protein